MFIDVNTKRPDLKEWMKKAADSLHFDIIRIIGVDPSNLQLFTMQNSENSINENDYHPFLLHCRHMIHIFEREQKGVLIDDKMVYEEEIYNKFNDSNSLELYVPIMKVTSTSNIVAGIVFFAWKLSPEIDLLTNDRLNELMCELYSIVIARYDVARKKESSYQVAYMLAEIIDIKEPYLISRLFNIAHWCEKIARGMGLPQTDIDKLQIATLMHDLGKIFISEDILNKVGKLTDQEYELVKKRVSYSYDIAQKLEALYEIEDLPQIILNYQERIDGKGYPGGKKGDEIPLLSKILSVAKAITSMMTNSSYRTAKTLEEVIMELERNSNTQFDERVVTAAIAVLANKQKYSEECLAGIGSFATFNMKINHDGIEKSLNIWGNIIKTDQEYIFTPTIKLMNYDKLIMQSCNLYINFNDQIIHYNPDIRVICEDKIIISNLKLDVDSGAFSINWLLPSLLVTPLRNVYEIFVTAIGGDHIDFYVFSNSLKEDFTEGVIQLTFDDGTKVALSGIIISNENVDNRTLFRLKYVGIAYKDMKTVYSQLFKKQIALRNLMNRLER